MVARSNVSNSLKELLNWQLIRVTHVLGDRRDYYETSSDVWELFRTVVRERKTREFDPTTRMLRELVRKPDFAQESPDAQDRVRETLHLMESLGTWADERCCACPPTRWRVGAAHGRHGAEIWCAVAMSPAAPTAPGSTDRTPPAS